MKNWPNNSGWPMHYFVTRAPRRPDHHLRGFDAHEAYGIVQTEKPAPVGGTPSPLPPPGKKLSNNNFVYLKECSLLYDLDFILLRARSKKKQ
jgi:hypothetical protein